MNNVTSYLNCTYKELKREVPSDCTGFNCNLNCTYKELKLLDMKGITLIDGILIVPTRNWNIAQAEKTVEEANELLEAVQLNNKGEIGLELGDNIVTLIFQAKMQNVDFLDCLELAYNKISKRKGKMQNGTFVKDK